MELKIILIFSTLLLSVVTEGKIQKHEKDVTINDSEREVPFLLTPDLVRYWGYTCEEHFVTTADGYVLGIHRIPHGKGDQGSKVSRPPVLLAHGMMGSSAQWVFGPPEKSMGFILADEGYDVWMVNMRGNTYSRNHTTLDTCSKCPQFWDYCWHEGGTQDFAAVIDYMLQKTEQEKVFFVGHSMGNTQYLVLLSERPEYNVKITAGFLMAPAAFMTTSTNSIMRLAEWAETIEDLYHWFGFYEFLPHPDLITWLGHMVCNEEEHPIYTDVCTNILFLLYGINPDQLNQTMIPVYLDHFPSGMSTRPLVHYGQLYLSDDVFQLFDFGSPEENLQHYGSETPREYNLLNIVAPTAIFIGESDDLATVHGGQKLTSLLPNVFHSEVLDYPNCTHFDFALGIDARKYVYDPIIEMMSNF